MVSFYPGTSWRAESTSLWILFNYAVWACVQKCCQPFPTTVCSSPGKQAQALNGTGKVQGDSLTAPEIISHSHWQVFVKFRASCKTGGNDFFVKLLCNNLEKKTSNAMWIPWPSLKLSVLGKDLQIGRQVPQEQCPWTCHQAQREEQGLCHFENSSKKGKSVTSSSSSFINHHMRKRFCVDGWFVLQQEVPRWFCPIIPFPLRWGQCKMKVQGP